MFIQRKNFLESVKKAMTISDTSLELMGNNNRIGALKHQSKFNEYAESYFNDVIKRVREMPSVKIQESFLESTMPTVSSMYIPALRDFSDFLY